MQIERAMKWIFLILLSLLHDYVVKACEIIISFVVI